MNRSLLVPCVLLLLAARTFAADVYMTRFDPPRAVLLHPTVNKGGPAAGIKGQDNFLSYYVAAVDNAAQKYAADKFALSFVLPPFLEVLDAAEQGLTVTPTQWQGQPAQQVTMAVDAKQMQARCFDNTWGVTGDLWYRVKDGAAIPAAPQPISLTLLHDGTPCTTDKATLRIHEPIAPGPRVSPQHFKLWLHYGPHVRPGHYDELAQTLKLAGINAIQYTVGPPGAEDDIRQMKQRGFFIIIQAGGSYESIYKDNMRGCLEQGAAWFEKPDSGTMQRYLPLGDAVLWDFEPSPMPDGLDLWLVEQFRANQKLPADEVLTTETIRAKYLRQYIEFRQTQLATCIKHWADYCRAIKPGIQTILTEGGVLAFDPTQGVDYAKYQDYVTYCDPMNFDGAQALQNVRQWMRRAPRAQFTGCQNVGLSSYHNVFVSPATIMLQTISAALIGQKGTAVYPGPAMDADNFVLWSRVMGFMGLHEQIMFEGKPDPANVQLALLPKEEQEVTLGDGRKLRNTYPDWSQDAIQRAYASRDGSELLAVVANWHAKEPAFGKLTATVAAGQWLLLDDENKQVFTQAGKPSLPAALLAKGVFVRCPPFDYRGWRFAKATPAALQAIKGYQPVKLEGLAQEAVAYAQTATGAGAAGATGDLKVAFDDVDRDGKFEYLVQSPKQKVWVAQTGTIVKWTVGDQTVETEGLGLGRDMLWLPQGERENRGMDQVMRLEGKQIKPEGVTLTFSKDVPLATIGGGASIRVTKEFFFPAAPGSVTVKVRLANTSVAPEATKITCSYRGHNYLRYSAAGHTLWVNDGAALQRWDKVDAHYSVPNVGLSEAQTSVVCAQSDATVTPPVKPASFGDYRPDQKLLVKFTPSQPERLLQVLRWGTRVGVPDGGTIEWMTKPETLAVGQDLNVEYRISVQAQTTLDAPATHPEAAATDPHLLFHLAFDGSPDATVARGTGKAEVTGTPTYEDTANGKGIVITKGTSLSYLPAGNVNLQRGRLAIRFKPHWEGADGQTHFLLTVRPASGFVYLGKLDDGRFLMNMFGPARPGQAEGDQHYGFHVIRTVQAGTWHEAMVTWDITKGVMLLFFDGQKVAEVRTDPWEMAPLDNALAHCRLTIPEQAEAVVDEVKVWDEP